MKFDGILKNFCVNFFGVVERCKSNNRLAFGGDPQPTLNAAANHGCIRGICFRAVRP